MTSEQIKARFRRQGVTIAQWADDHGFSRTRVYRVLNGVERGNYGKSHEIAVALGLKPGEAA